MFGADAFAVLTVGFDARNDTPAHMAQFAAVQGVKFDNWRLASADAGTISALLRDLGFSYVAVAGGFDHVTQTTIVDRDGKIYRHVYGDDFPVQMLIEPLKDVGLRHRRPASRCAASSTASSSSARPTIPAPGATASTTA